MKFVRMIVYRVYTYTVCPKKQGPLFTIYTIILFTIYELLSYFIITHYEIAYGLNWPKPKKNRSVFLFPSELPIMKYIY